MSNQGNYRRGVIAEYIALVYLWAKGYRIRARRYKCKVGEIDIIATRGRRIVFAEVKIRKDVAASVGAILPSSYARLARAAEHYIARYPVFAAYERRIDLIALAPPFHIMHLDNVIEGLS